MLKKVIPIVLSLCLIFSISVMAENTQGNKNIPNTSSERPMRGDFDPSKMPQGDFDPSKKPEGFTPPEGDFTPPQNSGEFTPPQSNESNNVEASVPETNEGVAEKNSKGTENGEESSQTQNGNSPFGRQMPEGMGGFPEVMENVTVSNIIVPDYEGNNDEYEKYLETINSKNLIVAALTDDTTFMLDDVVFEVSIPKKKAYAEGDNDFSLVISVTHGENTFLFAGDAEKDRLTEVLSEFGEQYDFLKVPHHGKYNKNTKRFIITVKPSYSVICDSQKNPAEDETIALLQSVGSAIYSTKEGDVSVSSNGKEIKIAQ